MAKMMGKNGEWGRCSCCGHGQKCFISRDIQEQPKGRAKEKEELRSEFNKGEHDEPSS